MKYSIDLQSPFSFSPYWYALGIALIVFALLLRFGFNRLFAVKMDSPFRIDTALWFQPALCSEDGLSFQDRQAPPGLPASGR